MGAKQLFTLAEWLERDLTFVGIGREHYVPAIFAPGEKLRAEEISTRVEAYIESESMTFEDFRRGVFHDVWGRA